jgi:DNA-directed RNA polymerase specialized sigma24 family protein
MGERGAKRGPGKTRELVRRYALLGLNQAEIARVVGVSREAVRVHLRRLREDGELQEQEAAS